MEASSKDKKKKPYSPPTLSKLTPEQARKLVADRTHCSDREVGEFLDSLGRKQQRNEERHPPNDANNAMDEKRKRSA
jgi:hypothetical protein